MKKLLFCISKVVQKSQSARDRSKLMKNLSIAMVGLFCLITGTASAQDLSVAYSAAQKTTADIVAQRAQTSMQSMPGRAIASVYVCTATCIIYMHAHKDVRNTVQGIGATRGEALIKLKAACDQKFTYYSVNYKKYMRGSELATSIDYSRGSSWDGSGAFLNISFDINKACPG